MRKRHVLLLIAVPIAAVTAWSWVLIRLVGAWFMLGGSSAPSPHVVHVTGHAAEKVVASRLTWKIELCGEHASAHAHEALRRGQKVFAAGELIMPPDPNAPPKGDESSDSCSSLLLTTSSIDAALAWHRALIAAGFLAADEGSEPECSGDELLAAAKSRTALVAINQSRAQADALLSGLVTPKRTAIDADVSHGDAGWDARCESIVTADAELTIPTSADPDAQKR